MRIQNLAIVFTDVKGFSESAARSSLEQNQALLEKLHALLEPVFEAFHGRIVKAVSDAYLVAFDSPTLAVLAAEAAQDELWKHNASAPPEARLALRTAVSAGEVTVEGSDVLGEPVAAAASVRDAIAPGDVALTEAVWLVVSRAEVKAELAGKHGEQGVYRVPRAAEGPPFGGQLMQRAPPVPTGELASPLTASALQAVRSPRTVKRVLAAAAAVAGIGMAVVLVKAASGPPPLDAAIEEVRKAPAAERSQKVVAAQGLIALEKEAPVRDYWYGRLQAAQDEENAPQYFRSAVRQGYAPAQDGLIELLKHRRCGMRVAAVDAIRELKLVKAKPALEALAEKGGPDDQQQVLFFGCNSRSAASQALDALQD